MVLKPQSIKQRLKELDHITQELAKYRQIELIALRRDLSQRWIIERGLIAATSIILDIADHILAGRFGAYVDTYEESPAGLYDQTVISAELYRQIQGLGGFRNILVHGYLDLNLEVVFEHYQKALKVFPLFAQEILAWLDRQGEDQYLSNKTG